MRGVSPATAGVRVKRATGACVTTVPKSSDARSSRRPRRAQKLSGAMVEEGVSTGLAADRPKRLREDVGFRPAYTFEAAVEHTYDWFRREKLNESLQFDFSWEDNLLERLGAADPGY